MQTTATERASIMSQLGEATSDAEIEDVLAQALRDIRSNKEYSATWESAVEDFLMHKAASTKTKTVHYYRTQLSTFVRWKENQNITLQKFGKREYTRYL